MTQFALSKAGINFISTEEGLRLIAYQDTGGIWTIGIGHTHNVKQGDTITPDQALILFNQDQAPVISYLNGTGLIKTQNQFDACCDYCHNAGVGNFNKLLLPAIKLGWTVQNLGLPIMQIVHDRTGKTLDDLVRRRMKELILMIG